MMQYYRDIDMDPWDVVTDRILTAPLGCNFSKLISTHNTSLMLLSYMKLLLLWCIYNAWSI